MGGGITAGEDGVGRGSDGLVACVVPTGLCRDRSTLWAAVEFCLRPRSGMCRPGEISSPDSRLLQDADAALDGQTTPKLAKRARTSLDASYSYLAGNAFGRDKKGRVTKDDSSTSAEMQAAGHMGDGDDYSAYVCYEFEIR